MFCFFYICNGNIKSVFTVIADITKIQQSSLKPTLPTNAPVYKSHKNTEKIIQNKKNSKLLPISFNTIKNILILPLILLLCTFYIVFRLQQNNMEYKSVIKIPSDLNYRAKLLESQSYVSQSAFTYEAKVSYEIVKMRIENYEMNYREQTQRLSALMDSLEYLKTTHGLISSVYSETMHGVARNARDTIVSPVNVTWFNAIDENLSAGPIKHIKENTQVLQKINASIQETDDAHEQEKQKLVSAIANLGSNS